MKTNRQESLPENQFDHATQNEPLRTFVVSIWVSLSISLFLPSIAALIVFFTPFHVYGFLIFSLIGSTIFFGVMLLQRKITIYPNRIVSSGLLGSQTLAYADILGYRRADILGNRGIQYVELVPSSPSTKPIYIFDAYLRDEAVNAWAGKLCDLDEVAKQNDRAKLEREAESSDTRQAPLDKIEKIRVLAKYVGPVYVIGAVLTTFFPFFSPLSAILLISGPWIALLLMGLSRGYIALDERPSPKQPSLLFSLVVLPVVTFTVRFVQADMFYGLQSYSQLLLPSLVGAGILATLLVRLSWGNKAAEASLKGILALLLILPIYVAGTLSTVNDAFDDAPVRERPLMVIGKHSKCGGRGGCEYWLNTATEPKRPLSGRVEVDYNLYAATQVGDTVCAWTHPGALGMQWMSIDRCTPKSRNAAPL